MKTASWIVLVVAGGATLALGLLSLSRAYGSYRDRLGPATVSELAQGRPEVESAVRGRRSTAAAFAAGFSTLFLAIALGPYRRGDVWAWWAIAAGTLVVSVGILLRVPLLGARLGADVGGLLLGIVGVGLALGAGRLRGGK